MNVNTVALAVERVKKTGQYAFMLLKNGKVMCN